MEALLRKYLWALDLLVIAICAVFLARASASLVESKLPVLPPPKAPPRLASSADDRVYSKDFDTTLDRNVFCSTCPPFRPVVVDNGPAQPLEPVKTSLPIQLVSTAISPASTLVSTSIAFIRDTESKQVGAFWIGQKIKGATITEIESKRVHIDNAGKPEFLDLYDEAPTTASSFTPAPSIAAAPPPSSDPLAAELDKGIKKLTEHTYEIQRQTLESVLGNMSLLSRSARIVPEMRDGKAAGFRLYSVRPDGPFAKIGMQNGDVISNINGLELTSPEKALEVYAKLKSAAHLSLGLERNGQRVTKDYSIR